MSVALVVSSSRTMIAQQGLLSLVRAKRRARVSAGVIRATAGLITSKRVNNKWWDVVRIINLALLLYITQIATAHNQYVLKR